MSNPAVIPARPGHRARLAVIIRFKNSAATLPDVLAALRCQTVQPDLIVAVDSGSSDGSADLLRSVGATILNWTEPYHHSRVLNHAISRCPAELILVLSSHTVLESADAIEQLTAAMTDPRTVCASGKWDDDRFYTDAIDWSELHAKGLKFGSIYSNSMGMIRRSRWEELRFDEAVPTMEDAAWAVEQVKRGGVCRRVSFKFRYQRSGRRRDYIFALITFQLAARHGLSVTWLGLGATLRQLGGSVFDRLVGRALNEPAAPAGCLWRWLVAWAVWRVVRPTDEC